MDGCVAVCARLRGIAVWAGRGRGRCGPGAFGGESARARSSRRCRARYDLGVAMLCRRGLARDSGEAARLLRGAADQGHSGAQSVLGWMLMSGRGVRHDDVQAANWLRRAAESGDTAAQNNLGVLYATGQGVPHDDAAAERWFRAAADHGAEMAARNLAVLRGESSGIRAGRSAANGAAAGMHPALASAGCRAAAPRT
ncbi:MAG: sel1 repeat family protein [Ideonella sp.]|nr:sel1 repeat family protein [Ideonella sp.]